MTDSEKSKTIVENPETTVSQNTLPSTSIDELLKQKELLQQKIQQLLEQAKQLAEQRLPEIQQQIQKLDEEILELEKKLQQKKKRRDELLSLIKQTPTIKKMSPLTRSVKVGTIKERIIAYINALSSGATLTREQIVTALELNPRSGHILEVIKMLENTGVLEKVGRGIWKKI